MRTAFIAFAMAAAVSSAFATYCAPNRFICTDPWGDELVSEEENAVGIFKTLAGGVARPLASDLIFPSVKDGNDVLLPGNKLAELRKAPVRHPPLAEQTALIWPHSIGATDNNNIQSCGGCWA